MPQKSTVHSIEPNLLKEWLEQGKALLIDVREESEYLEEHIPGSIHIPLSLFNPESLSFDEDKFLVFQCRLGRRSLNAATQFGTIHSQDTYSLSGGITAWKAAELPIIQNSAVRDD